MTRDVLLLIVLLLIVLLLIVLLLIVGGEVLGARVRSTSSWRQGACCRWLLLPRQRRQQLWLIVTAKR